MKLSVVIPWSNRSELRRSLTENAFHLRKRGIEVVLVNGGGSLPEVESIARDAGWSGIRVVHVPAATFNKPICLNLGAAFARAKTIFLLDADVVLTGGFLQKACNTVQNGACFVSIAKVIESEPDKVPHRWNRDAAIRQRSSTTRFTTANGRKATIVHTVTCDGTRTGPGLIVVARKHFVAVGGFNSNLTGWGFEDYDFQIRLQLLLGLKRRTFGRAVHLSHESVDGRETDWRNQQTCLENYGRGMFTGTYRADIERWKQQAVESRM